MNVRKESSKTVKPFYLGEPPSTTHCIPLSIFDIVTHKSHMAVIYAYKPPTPTNAIIEIGLRKVLSEYREWAGRLGSNDNGEPVILLNDNGVTFVEASTDFTLDQFMPFKPSKSLLSLHPSLNGVEELLQVQLTRFACGSLVVGFETHHVIADGQSVSKFLVAWGQASRGLDIKPCPLHDRAIFTPRDPPKFEFQHNGVEFISKKLFAEVAAANECSLVADDDVVVHNAHFTLEFISKLKAKASSSSSSSMCGDGDIKNKPYSTFVCLMAHIWRVVTVARGLNGFEMSHIKVSVNGRARINPPTPDEYFGNLALWAFPRARVKELLSEPLSFAAKLIHEAIAEVNDNYFKSFIDFASYKVGEENLVPIADVYDSRLSPNLEVDSWLRFPFYDLDFGCGSPFIFMPSYFPTEGMMFLLPSFIGDGSIDAFVPLFKHNLASFKKVCYSLD